VVELSLSPTLLLAWPPPTSTETPFGPAEEEPLNPPGVVLTLADVDPDERLAAAWFSVRHGLSLLMTIVVPPFEPETIEILAPDPLAVVVVSATAGTASVAASISVVVKTARIWNLPGLSSG
jgi:hypothetical protein